MSVDEELELFFYKLIKFKKKDVNLETQECYRTC